MKIDPVKWNRNVSLVYSVGVWTLFGYVFYKCTVPGDKPRAVNVVDENRPNVKVYETKYTRTVCIFKEDSVPYSTEFFNYIKSKLGKSTESQKQDEEK